MQLFPLSIPMGAYPAAQGSMVYGQTLRESTENGNAVMNGATMPNAVHKLRLNSYEITVIKMLAGESSNAISTLLV